MFFNRYQIPIGILDCLSDKEVLQLSMVNRMVYDEIEDYCKKRRAKMLDFLLTNHYRADYGVFSIHYYYSKHRISHRACFRIIVHFLPELFAFLEHHRAGVLDFGEFSRISSNFFFSVEEQREIVRTILPLIKHNRTFHYITLTMFREGLTWEQVEEVAKEHPCLWIDKATPTAFYHHRVNRT